MENFELKINIKTGKEKGFTASVLCTENLRKLPGKRDVYDALYDGKQVILKVFKSPLKSRLHLRKEWKGLSKLKQRKILAPEPLFYGQCEDRRWAVVESKVNNSTPLIDIYKSLDDEKEKMQLIYKIIRHVSKINEKGVYQTDLHLGNFMMKDNEIFTLDPAEMVFRDKPLSKNKSLVQLAIFIASIGDLTKKDHDEIIKEYLSNRSWEYNRSILKKLEKILEKRARKNLKKHLKKSLRTCSSYYTFEIDNYRGTFDRKFFDREQFENFIRNIDYLMQKGDILKNGNTTFVSKIKYADTDMVVKRYNNKGLLHSLRHMIKRSRAFWNWLHSKKLIFLNIKTPEPVCYIEHKKGPLLYNSYIITRFINGPDLRSVLEDKSILDSRKTDYLKKTRKLIAKMHENSITHGDLKHSNIIINEDEPALIDLDGMIVHKFPIIYQIKKHKDKERFYRSL